MQQTCKRLGEPLKFNCNNDTKVQVRENSISVTCSATTRDNHWTIFSYLLFCAVLPPIIIIIILLTEGSMDFSCALDGSRESVKCQVKSAE